MANECYKNSNHEYTYHVIKTNSKGLSGKNYHKLLEVISCIIWLIGKLLKGDWLERSFQTATPTRNEEQNPQNMKWIKNIKITKGII